jgi:hypothetical protein
MVVYVETEITTDVIRCGYFTWIYIGLSSSFQSFIVFVFPLIRIQSIDSLLNKTRIDLKNIYIERVK